MKKAILLKDLSENKIDKVIMNDKIKAGDWGLRISSSQSFFFTFTNYDCSSGDC